MTTPIYAGVSQLFKLYITELKAEVSKPTRKGLMCVQVFASALTPDATDSLILVLNQKKKKKKSRDRCFKAGLKLKPAHTP